MLGRQWLAALAGAVAVVGIAGSALAADANNDPTGAVANGDRYLAVSGSTIRIRITELLANDTPSRLRAFVRAFKIPGNQDVGGANPSSAGILRLIVRKKQNLILVRLRNNFVGDTSFKYEIRNGGRSRANVFINVLPRISRS